MCKTLMSPLKSASVFLDTLHLSCLIDASNKAVMGAALQSLQSHFLLFTCYLLSLHSFFIARQHTDARYLYSKPVCPSVRLFVRLSVTFWYQMKTA